MSKAVVQVGDAPEQPCRGEEIVRRRLLGRALGRRGQSRPTSSCDRVIRGGRGTSAIVPLAGGLAAVAVAHDTVPRRTAHRFVRRRLTSVSAKDGVDAIPRGRQGRGER